MRTSQLAPGHALADRKPAGCKVSCAPRAHELYQLQS